MKKFLLLLTSIVIFAAGCQTDTTTDKFIGVGNSEEGTSLVVSLAGTRTSLGEKVGTNYPVYWSEGDKLVVNGYLSDGCKSTKIIEHRHFLPSRKPNSVTLTTSHIHIAPQQQLSNRL